MHIFALKFEGKKKTVIFLNTPHEINQSQKISHWPCPSPELCPGSPLQEKHYSPKQNTGKRKIEPNKHWSIQWSLGIINNRHRIGQMCFLAHIGPHKILNSWLEMCSEPKLNSLYKFFFIISHSAMYYIHLLHSSSEPGACVF